jgi:hypothetical protein
LLGFLHDRRSLVLSSAFSYVLLAFLPSSHPELGSSALRARRGVSLTSPEEGTSSSYRNVVLSSYLEIRTMDKVQKLILCEKLVLNTREGNILKRAQGPVTEKGTRRIINRS